MVRYNPVVASAISQVQKQLSEQGGQGRVWIPNWKQEYGSLGSLKAFLESRPDKFKVVPGKLNSFEVASVSKGKTRAAAVLTSAKVRGGYNAAAKRADGGNGYDPDVAQVIREAKEQLREQGGQGKVWFENWKGRFGHLGSLRVFFESRPDKFTIISGPGSTFQVALPSTSERGGSTSQDARQVVGQAIREIRALVQAEGGQGRIWIENWGKRYGEACGGNLREFIESHSDKFTVLPGKGKAFEVVLVGKSIAGKGAPAVLSAAHKRTRGNSGQQAIADGRPTKRQRTSHDVGHDPVVAQAITEIKLQLREQGGQGQVWVDGWNKRFKDSLGTLREFLECRPDKFEVMPGEGTRFQVKIA